MTRKATTNINGSSTGRRMARTCGKCKKIKGLYSQKLQKKKREDLPAFYRLPQILIPLHNTPCFFCELFNNQIEIYAIQFNLHISILSVFSSISKKRSDCSEYIFAFESANNALVHVTYSNFVNCFTHMTLFLSLQIDSH